MTKMYKWNVLTTKEGKPQLQQVNGTKLQEYKGIKYFVNKATNNDGYVCTSFDAGLTFGNSRNTPKEAIEAMKEAIDKNGVEKVNSIIKNTIETYTKKEIEFPINPNWPPAADILYLKHCRTGKLIKSYEPKNGYVEITEEEFNNIEVITDMYFYHKESDMVDYISKERLEYDKGIVSKVIANGWQQIDKKTYETGMIKQCRQRLQKSINSNDISNILSIVRNNSNKYSIKAMSEITGITLDKTMSKRMKQLQEWLGEKYTTWKLMEGVKKFQAECQKEYEAEVKIQQATQEAKELFMEGKEINPEQFILLCKVNSINIPLKTQGWLNQHVGVISINNYTSTKGKKSTVIWNYIRELQNKLEVSFHA